jgi:hypothetical protein
VELNSSRLERKKEKKDHKDGTGKAKNDRYAEKE